MQKTLDKIHSIWSLLSLPYHCTVYFVCDFDFVFLCLHGTRAKVIVFFCCPNKATVGIHPLHTLFIWTNRFTMHTHTHSGILMQQNKTDYTHPWEIFIRNAKNHFQHIWSEYWVECLLFHLKPFKDWNWKAPVQMQLNFNISDLMTYHLT